MAAVYTAAFKKEVQCIILLYCKNAIMVNQTTMLQSDQWAQMVQMFMGLNGVLNHISLFVTGVSPFQDFTELVTSGVGTVRKLNDVFLKLNCGHSVIIGEGGLSAYSLRHKDLKNTTVVW